MTETKARVQRSEIVVLTLIFLVGLFLRLPTGAFVADAPLHRLAPLHPTPGFSQAGFDEGLYERYVTALREGGLGSYPDIVQSYIDAQRKLPGSILPPLRFLYIFAGYGWCSLFASGPLHALRDVAALFSILTLALAATFAWRMRGAKWALGVAALMACAPTQIHMSQHALVDGFFTFWALLALWLLWETLRQPGDLRWPAFLSLALALLVLTKENSFFVWLGLLAIIVANRWLHFGVVGRELLGAMIIGPLLGIVVLTFLAGGVGQLVETYRLSVSKNLQLAYAILTGDGPWQRYLIDLALVSPVILLLALARIFRTDHNQKPELYLFVFLAASYAVMCNVRYGMNLRYANMWDMALRFLAFGTLAAVCARAGRRGPLYLGLALAALCAVELRQYYVLFVQSPLYELVPEGLLRALHILKSP